MTRKQRIEQNKCIDVEDNFKVKDYSYLKYNLADDDNSNKEASTICNGYVKNWNDMDANGYGMLLYGDVGTGKTFFAKAMANAIRQQDTIVTVTSLPRIMNSVQSTKDKNALFDQIAMNELIVIDDLGAERESSFVDEQILFLLDMLAERKRVLIVTSNLDPEKMMSTKNVVHKRIYDRVLNACPLRLKLCGESRRKTNAKEGAERAMNIILGNVNA